MIDIFIILGCVFFYFLGRQSSILYYTWRSEREAEKVAELYRQGFMQEYGAERIIKND